jgi:hypothetical protein
MPRKGGVHVGQRVGCASEFGRESACGNGAAYVRGAGPRARCQGAMPCNRQVESSGGASWLPAGLCECVRVIRDRGRQPVSERRVWGAGESSLFHQSPVCGSRTTS